ncbi:MAG: hypothetical protein HS117_26560 [Verrucomicrobiaceae bacterium]|nr:hypothetical protein [Verrucomicrobiaceae bacterium]
MNLRPKPTTLLLAAFFSGVLAAQAQLTIPSDGSDGAFNPATNVEIDLGLATNGLWNSPGSGNGVYDAEKWAVVFKYSSVNIPAGVSVTFKNHPAYAPVVWLVQGNVTIDGELNLDGKSGVSDTVGGLLPTEPGPGGFRGGARGATVSGHGYGPGGRGFYGRYATIYGNPQIIPLIGGSGGYSAFGKSGAAGGGAIAIFASNTISIDGLVTAGTKETQPEIIGSGGAVRLVANLVQGTGQVRCATTFTNTNYAPVTSDSFGRIRIEANSLNSSLQTLPETIGVSPPNTPIIWPAANAPTAKVISVDSVNAPLDPRAPLVAGADVAIQNSNQVNILIETTNFPIEGVVQLNITPKFGNRTTHTATRLSGDITSATWQVQTTLPQGFVTLQARATQP